MALPLSPTALAAKAEWKPHPKCPGELINELTDAIMALPTPYFVKPRTGELFDSPVNALRRLNGFALTDGFAVVGIGGTEKGKNPHLRYACIHWGAETRNYRGLEERVRRDMDGVIVSDRKQDLTSIQKRDCQVRFHLAYKQVPRGSGVFHWVLKVPNEEHSHERAVFPLRYTVQRKQTVGHLEAVELAKSHREAFLTYHQSVRILDQKGLSINKMTYYNLKRQPFKNSAEGFEALIVTLEDAGFIFRCLLNKELDAIGNVVAQQCEQVWFALPTQVEFARRFISGFACMVDGTFSTNALNLTLIVVYGVTNTNKTFPACLSFARSESKLSFDFIFGCMKDLMFAGHSASPGSEATGNDIQANQTYPFPKVVVSDQAKGLIASLPTTLPNTTLQLCDWHAVQNIRKRCAEKRYTKEEREIINRQVWTWIKAGTATSLETAQAELFALLQEDEVTYIRDNWLPKKQQVLHFYTNCHPNLGANSNQRSEGAHPGIKQILNHQLLIEESTRRLGTSLVSSLRTLTREEANEGEVMPRLLDRAAFRNVVDYITRYAVDKVSVEWEQTKAAVDQGVLDYGDYSPTNCGCELLIRWGLPCRHFLLLSYLRGSPISKSLFHPRWWINGPPVIDTEWKPTEFTQELPLSPPRPLPAPVTVKNALTNVALQTLNIRDQLQGIAQAEFDQALFRANRGLLNEAQLIQQRHAAPVRPMQAVPKKAFLKPSRGPHGKTTVRSLTGTELAEKEANKEEAAAKAALNKARSVPIEEELGDTIEVVPGTPPPREDPSPSPEPPEPREALELPPSTAPARVEGAQGKRARAASGYYSALHAGDSQDARDKRQRQ